MLKYILYSKISNNWKEWLNPGKWCLSYIVNYNDFFVSLLWGNFRFVESWRLRANNDIKLFYFYVLLLKCLIYWQGSVKDFSFTQPKKKEGGRGEIPKRDWCQDIQKTLYNFTFLVQHCVYSWNARWFLSPQCTDEFFQMGSQVMLPVGYMLKVWNTMSNQPSLQWNKRIYVTNYLVT